MELLSLFTALLLIMYLPFLSDCLIDMHLQPSQLAVVYPGSTMGLGSFLLPPSEEATKMV